MHDRLRHYTAEASTQCLWGPGGQCEEHADEDLLPGEAVEHARALVERAAGALPDGYFVTDGCYEVHRGDSEELVTREHLAPADIPAARDAIAARVAAHLRAIDEEVLRWAALDEQSTVHGALQLAADLRASGARNVGELMDRVRESGAANLAEYRAQLATGGAS